MFPNQAQPSQQPPTSAPEPGSGLPPVLNHSGPVIPIDPNPPQLVASEPAPDPPQPSIVPVGVANATPEDAQPTVSNLNIDYLNQIAPTQQKTVNRFAIFGLIGGVLMAVVVFLIIVANSGPPNISAQTIALKQRIATLQSVADTQQPHIQDNDLSVANSTLSSTLTSMATDLSGVMKAKNVKTNEKSATGATEKTYAASLQKKLDDSYQRGTLDRTYAPQMTYELTVLRTKLKLLRSSSGGSKTVTSFCDTSLTNVDAILKAYARSTTPSK
ncbi:hypothetical protein IPM09_04410 [Candidatus Saccharibacteria bacterium]|nr:MAG: hypothetical protein IPM09_04410 [Candidatus Saccharibacteria bacterium]